MSPANIIYFFVDLCCGGKKILLSIVYPEFSDKRLYLLFDPTHNLKNAFNNWTQEQMSRFLSEYSEFLRNGGVADFRHSKDLFFNEETMPMKIAYSVNIMSLNPNSIARTSPQHALGGLMLSYEVMKNVYVSNDLHCSRIQ